MVNDLQNTKKELLAPAGDLTRLSYALAYGADAVYAGQPAFSLRARENGFKNLDDLAEGISLCRKAGKKFYLTSNVIARNTKVESFQKALLAAIELKPDALIVADPGIIGFLRKKVPQQELHLSVQANTTNWLTAKYWAEQGIKRIILSRELRLEEVQEIHKRVPEVELEVFVHGSVCMAMSGRCMLSNWVSHRDANQGACNNSCRMPYKLYANADVQEDSYQMHQGSFSLQRSDKEDLLPIQLDEDSWGTYFMSSRDLCALEGLPALMEGDMIASYKIEGRTRSIYYLSQVIHAYRLAIDACALGKPIPEEARHALMLTDNRGWMPGFGFKGPLPQNYEATHVASNHGCVAAQIMEYNATEGRCFFKVKNPFDASDSFELLTPQGIFPCRISHIQNADGNLTERLHPGTNGSSLIQTDEKVNSDHFSYAFLIKKKTNL